MLKLHNLIWRNKDHYSMDLEMDAKLDLLR
jgi:hypothetical protein